MFIVQNKRKKSWKEYIYTFLAEGVRVNGKPTKKILANLSHLPPMMIDSIKLMLKSKKENKNIVEIWDISVEKSIDWWYFAVIIEIIKKLKIDKAIKAVFKDDKLTRIDSDLEIEKEKIVLIMIIGKIITRWSKLCIVNWTKRNTEIIEKQLWLNSKQIESLTEKDFYSVQIEIDAIQQKIEKKWFLYNKEKINRIYLYDITSFYFEWIENELSRFWYNRDKKKWKRIITTGLITNEQWFPLKISTIEWNINDEKTVIDQLKSLKEEFWAKEIIFVWDRWMKIKYNLENMNDKEKKWIDYISGLTIDEIRDLEDCWTIQYWLFDKELSEVEIEQRDKAWNLTWKTVRYILCVNPVLEEEKKSLRLIFKAKFEKEILDIQIVYEKKKNQCETNKEKIQKWLTKNKKLKTKLTEKEIDSWKYRTRKAQEKYKMTKIYTVTISQNEFTVTFSDDNFNKAWKYDWKYVFETTVKKEVLNKEEVRNTYKKLQKIEHSFRDMKTSRLNIRPIFHRKADTTRSHILIWMFAYAVINEIECGTIPWLRDLRKTKNKLSVNDVIEELKMIKLNILSFGSSENRNIKITKLNDKQKKIFELLNINESIFQ